MDTFNFFSTVAIIIGVLFMIIAAIGINRFPDFFSRCHPAGKTDTLGQGLVIIGLLLHQGLDLRSVKLLMIFSFISVANPTITHSMMRAAYLSGLKPWSKEKQ